MMWYDSLFCIPLGYGIGKSTRKKLNQYKNIFCYQNVFSTHLSDMMDSIDIKGLPDTISKRVILQSLVYYGSVVFFEKGGSLFGLPGVPSGDGYNINGDPGKMWVFSRNGIYNEEIPVFLPGSDESAFLKKTNAGTGGGKRGVVVWDNSVRFPLVRVLSYYSEQISDTLRTIEASRRNLKNPFIIVCDESLKNTVDKFFQDRDTNESYSLSSGSFTPDKIVLLPVSQNDNSINTCIELVEWYENKLRELSGLKSNSQLDKKGENLISDEIHVNDEYENLQIEKRIMEINKGLELCNTLFGTNMEAVKNENIIEDIRTDEGGAVGVSDSNTDGATGADQ